MNFAGVWAISRLAYPVASIARVLAVFIAYMDESGSHNESAFASIDGMTIDSNTITIDSRAGTAKVFSCSGVVSANLAGRGFHHTSSI
jgi:hypothetical protein